MTWRSLIASTPERDLARLMKRTCEPFEEQLSALVDGELDAGELELVSEHLENCSKCADLLSSFKRVDQVVLDPEQAFERTVVLPRGRQFSKISWTLMATTAALLLVGLTIFWPTPEGSSQQEMRLPKIDLAGIEALHKASKDSTNDRLKTMELRLRAMRVSTQSEANQSDEHKLLVEKIDNLLADLRAIEQDTR